MTWLREMEGEAQGLRGSEARRWRRRWRQDCVRCKHQVFFPSSHANASGEARSLFPILTNKGTGGRLTAASNPTTTAIIMTTAHDRCHVPPKSSPSGSTVTTHSGLRLVAKGRQRSQGKFGTWAEKCPNGPFTPQFEGWPVKRVRSRPGYPRARDGDGWAPNGQYPGASARQGIRTNI